MKLKTVIKNVLLGSVAGLAMVGTAAAADLPVKVKAAEYVKICSTYGAGFYYIPGTDTCLKVGGYVTADTYYTKVERTVSAYEVGEGFFRYTGKPDGQFDFYSRAAVQLDARTQTEYGTLRSYIEARIEQGQNYGYGLTDDGTTSAVFSDTTRNRAVLKYGYIQFAGFTFGQATSAFDFWAGDGWYGIRPGNFYSDQSLNVIQYTADFGNGFSATIALEDGQAREDDYGFGDFTPFGGSFTTQGQQVPDIVANIAYEGTWGAFKISGAYHNIGDVYYVGLGGTGFISSADDSGWAALAGVRFDFAETTTLYVEGAYSKGAPGYLGLAGALPVVDYYGDGVAGWYVGGSLTHYWTPAVFTTLVGSYTASDDYAVDNINSIDFTGYNVGVNIGWKPVKGLTLVLQYDYLSAEYSGGNSYFGTSVTDTTEQNRVTFSAKRSF
ncbi:MULTISPECIES: porin [Ancylobacter]|uniref:porin n=1 Tax=Ancylobacter TaxID=99 RepID=UPI0027D7AA46|nr:porin [Ancylobacter polymorphus]